MKIPREIPIETAATLSVNLCSAYRMLHDFGGGAQWESGMNHEFSIKPLIVSWLPFYRQRHRSECS